MKFLQENNSWPNQTQYAMVSASLRSQIQLFSMKKALKGECTALLAYLIGGEGE
jgi:hypothetical protein